MTIKKARAVWTRRIKRASIETDMAARIMLSLIPEVMDPIQRANIMADPRMWSTDVKAYRAAVKGAKALIINGAKACVGELRHYKDKAVDDDDDDKVVECKRLIARGKEAIEDEDWAQALRYCSEAFEDEGAWESAYGGKAWATIAETLLQINAASEKIERERKANNWEGELDAMKQTVVLMNVFDGLAHNTGSVMPKLLMEENGISSYESENRSFSEDFHKYKSKVLRLMDAKELRNPIAVYREVEPIVDSSSYRYLFKDFIHKLRQHPGYRQTTNVESQLEKIRAKKTIAKEMNTLSEKLQKLTNAFAALKSHESEWLYFREAFYAKKDAILDFNTDLLAIRHAMSSILNKLGQTKIGYNSKLNDLYGRVAQFYSLLGTTFYQTWIEAASEPQTKFKSKDIDDEIKEIYERTKIAVKQFQEEIDRLFAE